MAIVNISDELYQELQDLLNSKNSTLSPDALVEATMAQYLTEFEEVELDAQDLADLKQAVAEAQAQKKAGTLTSLADAQAQLLAHIRNYQDKKVSA